MAEVVNEWELQLSAITLRPFDDGRFVVRVNGDAIYDKRTSGRFPEYAVDIKPELLRAAY